LVYLTNICLQYLIITKSQFMKPNKIFEDKARTDLNFKNHLDDLFDFYDRSAKPEFAKLRDTINEWYEDYPDSEKAELKSRFKKTFSPAFFELFIYRLFTSLGFTLTPHPKIEGTDKAPDFLAEKDSISFYIEAKEVTDTSEAEASSNKNINAIYDALSKLIIPNYWLFIEKIEIKSVQQPSGKKITEYLKRQLPNYISSIAAANIELADWAYIEPLVIDRNDIELVVRLFPKSSEHSSDESTPTIGGIPGSSGWGYSEEGMIRNAVHKKASRYGELDKPYIICINAFNRFGITTTGVENALLGSLVNPWPSNFNDAGVQQERAKNGIFYSESRLAKTRVSGILVTNVFPSNIDVAPHWLAKHPCGKMELDFSHLKLSHQEFDGTYWHFVHGQSIGNILKLK
jgi:hypothetical protein